MEGSGSGRQWVRKAAAGVWAVSGCRGTYLLEGVREFGDRRARLVLVLEIRPASVKSDEQQSRFTADGLPESD
jgi:hypothetical protein